MKKSVSLIVWVTIFLGMSQLTLADVTATNAMEGTQNINGQASNFINNTADVEVNGTLGAVPNPQWLNVTIPIETIFYSLKNDLTIKSPTYTIKNNSGRPVDVSINSLAHLTTDILPNDFDLVLNLASTSTENKQKSTSLIENGKQQSTFPKYLVTLANNEGKQTKSATPIADSYYATYTYSGYATVNEQQNTNYQLSLKFVPVTFGYAYF